VASILQRYNKLEEWVQNLPRLEYAVVVGFASCLGILVISLFLREITIINAGGVGIISTLVYYAFDPR
jgi:hypothetical protein